MTEPLDEARLARMFARGLPIVTLLAAAALGVTQGLASALIALIAGALLGVIAIFWSSLRVLTGDAPLGPELEAVEAQTDAAEAGVTAALEARKAMLVRSLKDLENERDIGKLEAEDFALLAQTSRAELKEVLRQIDAMLEPHRAGAEELVRAHLARAGVEGTLADGAKEAAEAEASDEPAAKLAEAPSRRACTKCGASNEPDAKFCKECAAALGAGASLDEAEAPEAPQKTDPASTETTDAS